MSMSYSKPTKSYEPGAKIEGGIPLCVPEMGGNEWAYIKDCLDTGWVSSVGLYVTRFENEIAATVGTKYAIACVNGTAALHIALLVAGVEPDDEVLMPSLTFIAPANAVRYAGAWPVFIDSEPEYWQMDPALVADFFTNQCERSGGVLRNKSTGRRVKAIMPVHVGGHPVDMDAINPIAHEYDLPVIEDATESLGATYKGQLTGRLGDIACFSFNGNKVITSGGGGMIVTDDEQMAAKARYLTTQAKDDPVEYVHYEIGYNYRLTNIQAALGCAQLELLDEYLAAKRRIAETYREAFEAVPGIAPMPQAEWVESTFWLYTILVDEDVYGMDSRALLKKLGERKIQSRPLWQPIHLSKAHANSPKADCPVAERLNRMGLSIPSSVGLTAAEQAAVIEAIVG